MEISEVKEVHPGIHFNLFERQHEISPKEIFLDKIRGRQKLQTFNFELSGRNINHHLLLSLA